jgi:CDP-diacylglycerol pyrophosphatase
MDQPSLTKRRLNFWAVERPHTLAIQSLVFVRCALRSSGRCRVRPGRAVESDPIVRRGPCSHRRFFPLPRRHVGWKGARLRRSELAGELGPHLGSHDKNLGDRGSAASIFRGSKLLRGRLERARFLTARRKIPLAHDDVALAVNSRESRSQDQLHIHIGCLSGETKQTFASLALQLPEDRWVRIGQPMTVGKGLHAAGFWGRRVARESIAEVNPFRLAAEAPNDSEVRAHTMIVVAGVELARGRDGFVLLASHGEPSGPGDQASAEDFLDASCSS